MSQNLGKVLATKLSYEIGTDFSDLNQNNMAVEKSFLLSGIMEMITFYFLAASSKNKLRRILKYFYLSLRNQ